MNNKGFTLIEVLLTITILSLILIMIISISGNTLSISNEEAYNITKKNIINATDKYIYECENNINDNCKIIWHNNKTVVKAKDLIEAGYFQKLTNPINNINLSECLTIEVQKNDNNKYNINDYNCK